MDVKRVYLPILPVDKTPEQGIWRWDQVIERGELRMVYKTSAN